MSLSSNSIIHLTEKKESLIGILKDNFKIKYCAEDITTADKIINAAFPIVSFCDIPLSQIKEHINKYGHYGLGLKKKWATREGLNPILYIDENSTIGKEFSIALSELYEKKNRKINFAELKPTEKAYFELIRYMKNYEGKLTRNGETKEYRFSDEREWRYVLNFTDGLPALLGKSNTTHEKKQEATNEITERRLKFTPNDISYIFIKEENEISEFIDVLKKSKGKSYTYDDVERLSTRIITTEQIFTDF